MTEASGIVGEFFALKEEAEADLLAMQCGDFYEFFGDDAELVEDELDLKVSRKSSGGESYPMAGVPVDDLTPYLRAMVERGYRVAVADQYETESGHAREVTRVVTPGTLLSATDADARFLAAVVDGGDGYGLGLADVTTGRFLVADADDAATALSELARFDPAEVLPGPDGRVADAFLRRVRERTDATLSVHDAEAFAPGRARHAVHEQFGRETPESVGLDSDGPAIRAAGAVLDYVEETGTGVLASMTRLRRLADADRVALDATTRRNLELVETMQGGREGSLLATVDHTVTAAGGRLLAEWLQRPRRDRSTLDDRLDAVAALAGAAMAREELREALGDAADAARLASRAASGSADAGDLRRVADTLAVLPALAETVEASPELRTSPLADLVDRPDRAAAADLRAALDGALVEDPPSTVTEGGLFRRGHDDELDGVVDRHEELREWFDGLADRVSARTGLSRVTVDRNATDGYYVQVGRSEADDVPDRFDEIKTLKNSKRFVTDELGERERELLRLEERRGQLEYELFVDLRERVADRAELLQVVGRAIARVDVLCSLATHAVRNDWTRPELREDRTLSVEAGRHPVVEQTTEFVPNDVAMDDDRSFLVVTGPNMSGKSTYMRQVALIVLLAQVGSFVPAREAAVGLVDGVYTRVGALDELAQGRSTFMVEMQELSNILHSAGEDSLVVLDEVGRGTATYDGISIAWAATEYLVNEVDARTLFATHYHELTDLADRLPGVHNVHLGADERDGDVTFLRTVREGAADRSYGIHVADLAGVPEPVVDRSRDVLWKLREEKAVDVRGAGDAGADSHQVVFDLDSGQFRGTASADGGDREPADPGAESVLDDLRTTDVAEVAPVDLLERVREWQRRLDE